MIETGEFDLENRLVEPREIPEDDFDTDYSLRPKTLAEYIGQDKVKENMAIYIEAAKRSRRTSRIPTESISHLNRL